MNDNHYCVIMVKGSGRTALRMTYDRFAAIIPAGNILVVTPVSQGERVRRVLPELPPENLLLEPYARGTGPCMAYAAYTLLLRNPQAVIIATPADHVIDTGPAFRSAIENALSYASVRKVLITLGLVPRGPEPGFGYIQVRDGTTESTSYKPLKVKTFVEKPTKDLAAVFIRSGEFFWNSGIFVWTAAQIREEMEKYIPEVTQFFEGWQAGIGHPSERAFIERAYADCPKVSLDYGVMEKTERAWLYPARFLWADLGSLETAFGMTIITDENGNLIYTNHPERHFTLLGIHDTLLICTEDLLLAGPRDAE